MTAPLVRPPAARRAGLDPARARVWLGTLVAVLLVLLYLSLETTYASAHLPPPRFHPVVPGGVAHGPYADFRLLSLRQTEQWGQDVDGSPGSPDPGAVWVVASLEVTPRKHQDYLLCTLSLVSADGRSWAAEGLPPAHQGASCVPDPEDVQLGTTYPFVLGFQVPLGEADHLAGLGLQTYSWRASPLLRPPG